MSKKDRRFNLLDRRDSIALAETRMQSIIGEHLLNLRSIWDEVGMDEDQRRDRIDSVITHVDSLFIDMTNEENEMAQKLVETIKEYNEEIFQLAKELHWTHTDFKPNKRLIEAECDLRSRVEELRTEKNRRLKIYKQLFDEDMQICKQMAIAVYSIAPNSVPTERQLNELGTHIETNRRDLEFRRSKLIEMKSKILRLMTKLELFPKSDIETKICTESVDDLPLTSDFLNDLETLQSGLQIRYDDYLENVRHQVGEMKDKLERMWKSCHVDETYRNNFQHVNEEDFDENALERYNAEIARWQSYYEERQEVLDKIECWHRLWNEKLQYEEKDKDCNRFLNRGGALLQEEKERKKLERKLPMVQEEIKKIVQQWNKIHPGQPFLLERLPVDEYLEQIQKDHQQKKEVEKQEKQLAKKQQLEAERMYGASPVAKQRPMANLRRVNASPNSQNRDFAASRTYGHSTLAMTRSPAAPSSKASVVSCRPPPGLPRPASKNVIKRKAVDDRLAPLSQANSCHDVSAATTHSSGTYNEFVQEIREKGLQGQSSFLVIPTPTPTPTPSKVMKR